MVQGTIDPLFDPVVVEQPHDYYRRLREADPVHHIAGTDAYLVARLDLIQEVVADTAIYSSRSAEFLHLGPDGVPSLLPPMTGPIADAGEVAAGTLAAADPPDHGRQRKVISRVLSTGAIHAREAEFRALIDQALDPIVETGSVEWMRDVAEPLPMVMVARVLGLPDATAPALKESGYAAVEQISGFVAEDRRPMLEQAMADLGPVVDAYMAARSRSDPDQTTVIGACAQAVADGELDDMEAFGMLAILLAAGGESTTSLLGTGARILAEQPELQARLRAEPDLIPRFVEEACRVDPPFRGHYRRVLRETELGGVTLPAGARLVLLWPAANRDPETFTHPEEVDLGRQNPRHHLGFGWGIHLCVGAPLARMEAKVTFEQLLGRTSTISIEAPSAALRHHRSLMIRRLVELPLALTG
jgi:cytochrome P450